MWTRHVATTPWVHGGCSTLPLVGLQEEAAGCTAGPLLSLWCTTWYSPCSLTAAPPCNWNLDTTVFHQMSFAVPAEYLILFTSLLILARKRWRSLFKMEKGWIHALDTTGLWKYCKRQDIYYDNQIQSSEGYNVLVFMQTIFSYSKSTVEGIVVHDVSIRGGKNKPQAPVS